MVPQVLVRYRREPFTSLVDDYARVTLDREIQVQPCSELSLDTADTAWLPIDDPIAMRYGRSRSFVVLELKFATVPPPWMRRIVQSLELPRLSFSKYARAIEAMLDRPGRRVVLGA
jgi:hypothetical protein